MVIKGGSWSVMEASSVADITTDVTFSGAAAKPLGGLVCCGGVAESTLDTPAANWAFSFGCFDGSLNCEALCALDLDAQDTSVAVHGYSSTDACFYPFWFISPGVNGGWKPDTLTPTGAVGKMTDAANTVAQMLMLAVSDVGSIGASGGSSGSTGYLGAGL
jgi:hypothetical protein